MEQANNEEYTEKMLEILTVISSHANSGRLATALGRLGMALGEQARDMHNLTIINEVLQSYEEKLAEMGAEVSKLKTYRRNAKASARNYQKAYQELQRRVLKLTVQE